MTGSLHLTRFVLKKVFLPRSLTTTQIPPLKVSTLFPSIGPINRLWVGCLSFREVNPIRALYLLYVRGERRAVPPDLGIVREVGTWPASTVTISARQTGRGDPALLLVFPRDPQRVVYQPPWVCSALLAPLCSTALEHRLKTRGLAQLAPLTPTPPALGEGGGVW